MSAGERHAFAVRSDIVWQLRTTLTSFNRSVQSYGISCWRDRSD